MKVHQLVMLMVGVVAITAITLGASWGRDASRGERMLVSNLDDLRSGEPIEALLNVPINLDRTYRVNCADNSATDVLVPMDGGTAGTFVKAASLYIAPCEFDNDGGPASCLTQRDVRVGNSTVNNSKGFDVGAAGREGRGISMDAKGAWCAGVGGAQQVDVVVGVQ